MRILLINHYAGSTRHGMEFRPYYLAREWVKAGHEVMIVAASYSHIRAKQPEFDGPLLDETIDGIKYRWYDTPAYDGNGARRVINMIAFLWALWRDAMRLVSDFRPEVVIASSTYPMDVWVAKRLAKRAKAKLIYEVHDLWPLTPIELGGMSKWHPFILWVQWAEDYAYRTADKVVSLLPNASGYMESRGMNPAKFAYVPNGISEEEWTLPAPLPPDVQKALMTLRETGRPVVGYAGTHGLANALDVLLDAAALLRVEAHIVLVGTGPEKERLLERVKCEALENVLMFPAIPKASIPSFLEAVDAAYIGLLPEPLFRFGISPNKLMDYMMAAKPIVMAIDAGNDPVAEAKCGYTVPPGDAAAVADAIRRLLEVSPAEREAMGLAGKRFVQTNQTYPVLARRFLDMVRDEG